MIEMIVHGFPGPQGSKVMFAGGGSRESSKKVRPWREAVKHAALALDVARLEGPVVFHAEFRFRRPASHYRTGRNAHLLRDSAPRYPTGKTSVGDLSKLVRSTEDALTDAGIWDDDCYVVRLGDVTKVYAEMTGAWIGVETVDEHAERTRTVDVATVVEENPPGTAKAAAGPADDRL